MPTPAGARVFRELARMHVRAQRREIACQTVSETHCTLLTEIGRGDRVRMRDLVARLQLDKGWVSRAVEQLVQDGLAERRTSDTDRRAVTISLTAAGRRLYRRVETTLNRQLDRVFLRLRPADRALVARALDVLYDAYETEVRDGGPATTECA
jgi:DNA-binding MarR family transcriptional regulator